MPRLLDYLAPLYVWLYALDPMLPQALFVSLVFFTVLLLRKRAPNKWEAFANLIHVKSDDTAWWQNELRALWQMLPAAIIGTIYGVLGTGGELWPTLKATLLSLLAPVVHRIAKRYRGEVGPLKGSGGGGSPLKLSDEEKRALLREAVSRNGGTIQKVEIVVTSNQHPNRIARAVCRELSKLQRPLSTLTVVGLLLMLPSCANWKPIARTTNDVARALCGQFFGEKQGISVEEAAKKFCETRDDLAPWLDTVLAAKQAGGKAALARPGATK